MESSTSSAAENLGLGSAEHKASEMTALLFLPEEDSECSSQCSSHFSSQCSSQHSPLIEKCSRLHERLQSTGRVHNLKYKF